MKRAKILIIEDDYDIRRANRIALELVDYEVAEAENLADGRRIARAFNPDLIILDILLPDGSGLAYCGELRGKSSVRILFLSALSTKEDTLAGLRAGGDDYVSKPYDMDELILRVEALLRRGQIGQTEPLIQLGALELHMLSRRAQLNGCDLMLKPKEFALLEILIRNSPSAVAAEELYQKVWGMDTAGDLRTVKEHISRIRSKLKDDSAFHIIAERGKGYRLDFEYRLV